MIEPMDRLSMRARPNGTALMHQTWEKLLFMHWPFAPEMVQSFLPRGLDVDTFNGVAWVALTPFTISNLTLTGLPAIPGASSFHELNLRTYVHANGIPGVWFFSLEASKLLPVIGARTFYWLNYRHSDMIFRDKSDKLEFIAHREDKINADFQATWIPGEVLPEPEPDSLEFFLVERYALYAARDNQLMQARIYHSPWELRSAELLSFETTMFDWLGLPNPIAEPLLHFSTVLNVDVWPPVPV
jgi:uncharacterized protein YqjF (DUF2071 family)